MGRTMDQEDIILKVLKGLDYETYKPVIDSINARDTFITFEELHEKLINHRLFIQKNITPFSFPASVHAANYLQNSYRGQPKYTINHAILPTPTI